MDQNMVKGIVKTFADKSNAELIAICREHNEQEWSQEACEAARQILSQRGEPIPITQTPKVNGEDVIGDRKAPGLVAASGLLGLFGIGMGLWGLFHFSEPSWELRSMYSKIPVLALLSLVGNFVGLGVSCAYVVGAFMTNQGDILGLKILHRSFWIDIDYSVFACVALLLGISARNINWANDPQVIGLLGSTVVFTIIIVVICYFLIRATKRHLIAWPKIPAISSGKAQVGTTSGLSEELARLAKLRAEGSLSEEEYTRAKAKLL